MVTDAINEVIQMQKEQTLKICTIYELESELARFKKARYSREGMRDPPEVKNMRELNKQTKE